MKIKELFEEIKSSALMISLSYQFSIDHNNKDVEFRLRQHTKSIKEEIAAKCGTRTNCVLNISNTRLTVILSISKHELDSIAGYRDDVISVLSKYVDIPKEMSEDVRHCDILFNGELQQVSHPINFPALYFKPIKEANLSGIAKFVGEECNCVYIGNCQLITGNVLGLVRLAEKGIRIELEFAGGQKLLNWMSIVKKHLIDKDILECQEELIDAGLKEFAKL